MKSTRFSFAVMSTGKRPEKTTEPQLVVTTTKGTFKLNGAATRLIGLQHGDYAALVNNESDLSRAIASGDADESTPITWGVIKGYTALGKDGKPRKSVKRLTDEEAQALIDSGEVDDDGNVLPQYEDKMVGFKLACTNKAMGLGNTLQGSDAVNYVALGGNPDENIVYSIEVEPTSVEVDGTEIDVYILGEQSTLPKMQRG